MKKLSLLRLGWTGIIRLAALAFLMGQAESQAAEKAVDWPQWRGPNRDGICTETDWRTNLSDSPPKVLWEARLGRGYSSVAISQGRLFTMATTGDRKNHQETVFCLDAKTGKELWKHTYSPTLPPSRVPVSSTPAVVRDAVYTIGNGANIFCFEAATGKIVWSKDMGKEGLSGSVSYGYDASPLVVSGRLIVPGFPGATMKRSKAGGNYPLTGGILFAFDVKTGKEVWRNEDGASAWSSPVVGKVAGRETLVHGTGTILLGIDPANGKTLWKFDARKAGLAGRGKVGANATTPILAGDKVIFMGKTGQITGITVCLQISGGQTKLLWKAPQLNHWYQSPVVWKDHLYAVGYRAGDLFCCDLNTGETKWSTRDFSEAGGGRAGRGNALIISDGKIITVNDEGFLVVGDISEKGHKVLGFTKVPNPDSGKWRNEVCPVLWAGRLYLRNSRGYLVCLDMRGK